MSNILGSEEAESIRVPFYQGHFFFLSLSFFPFFFYSKHCRDISIGKDRMEKIPWLNLRSMGTLVFLVPLLIDFIRGAQF